MSASTKRSSPWLVGVLDTLVGARLVRLSGIPHRNRLAVILLDSAFETACRSYLRYKARINLTDAHRHRQPLVKTVRAQLKDIDRVVWDNIDFYYQEIRCDFYHQSAGKTITDESLDDYQETIEFVIDRAFEINCGPIVEEQYSTLPSSREEDQVSKDADECGDLLSHVSDRAHKVLIAVESIKPSAVEDVNDFFRREGESLRLKKEEFTNIVGRNSGSKRFFYHNKEFKRWELSGLGRFKLKQLSEEFGDA